MRRWSVALAVVWLAWLAAPIAAQNDTFSVPRVSVADTKKALDAGTAIVVDVRDAASFSNGRIPGSVLLTPADLVKQAASLKASKKTIITVCA